MGKRGVFPPPSTVYWLRDLLDKVGEINPYGFYTYCRERGRAETDLREAIRWSAVSYDSVRRLFYMLNHLGLIQFTREEPGIRGGQPKRFYAMIPSMDEYWQGGLQVVFWPDTYWGGRGNRYWRHKGEELPPSKLYDVERKREELLGGE